MENCSMPNCGNWAQWEVSQPDKTKNFICQPHKEEVEKLQGIALKFKFIGAKVQA